MVEKEEFKIGDYTAKCTTDYASPSFAKAQCKVTKDGEPRAQFDFEVDRGKVLKADALMQRATLDELKADDSDSEKEIADIKDFMDANKLKEVTLTVLESEEKIKKSGKVWGDVASKFMSPALRGRN